MSKNHCLVSLMVLLGAVASAQGQNGLSPSAAPDADDATRLQRPTLMQMVRNVLAPNRSQSMAPQPVTEPLPTRDGIARMIADGSFSPAEITAAKIKIEEAQAEARKSAVRYLATVDCHYYPEAELSLIAALRADRNEAVRLEAALALGTCRGATRRITEALSLTALGQETDGNPSETSERVRQAARNSLNRVLTGGMAMYPIDAPSMNLFPVQTTGYYAPTYPMVTPAVSPKERDLAETVSTQSKKSGSTTAPSAPRSLVEWLQNYTGFREPQRNVSGPAAQKVDPRLRGLTPVGSESTLAIPNLPALLTARTYNED